MGQNLQKYFIHSHSFVQFLAPTGALGVKSACVSPCVRDNMLKRVKIGPKVRA